jgi:FtsZ-binding cell division protein ZapB
MNRYNQGFWKFGPMEQCKDGIWGLYADFLRVLQYAVKSKNEQIEVLTYELDKANAQIKKLESRLQYVDKEHRSFIDRIINHILPTTK